MKIPITMCHGINATGDHPLTAEHFNLLIGIAADLGFTSIDYEDLAAWRDGSGTLPARPVMFDFDHPVKSMRYEVHDVLSRHGFTGNLFINTGPLEPDSPTDDSTMTWSEIRELVDLGWHIGAHTVTHPNLSELSREDPLGEKLAWEFEQCDRTLMEQAGVEARDFAFTGTSWSSAAEKLVQRRYRFGRLWIVGTHYQADGERIRYAELAGVTGADEADGGPPLAARYITRETPAHRLPSMEIQTSLMHQPERFRRYLEGAME